MRVASPLHVAVASRRSDHHDGCGGDRGQARRGSPARPPPGRSSGPRGPRGPSSDWVHLWQSGPKESLGGGRRTARPPCPPRCSPSHCSMTPHDRFSGRGYPVPGGRSPAAHLQSMRFWWGGGSRGHILKPFLSTEYWATALLRIHDPPCPPGGKGGHVSSEEL